MKFIEALVAVAQRNAIKIILSVSCNTSLLTKTLAPKEIIYNVAMDSSKA